MSLEQRWQEALAALRAEGRYRCLLPPSGIDFSSNDYLGYGKLREGEAVREGEAPAEPPARHGSAGASPSRSGCASRLLRGHHPIWDEVETTLADWHGAEATLFFTSGYVANEGLLSTIIEPEDWVASDEFNHASIIDGLRMAKAEKFIFRHNDLNHVESGLKQARRLPKRRLFIVTESLFGMEGDRAPLLEMAAIAERHGAHLIVDEAHVTGCFGATGSGLVDAQGLRQRVLATVHTGGKALAVPGAYVSGSRLLKELLINRCRHFIFTTALPLLVGSWWLQALARARSDESGRRRLHDNAALFRARLPTQGTDYIAPIMLGADAAAVVAAERLQAAGFDVRAIRPPSVPLDTARLRIAIHADHTRAQLEALAETLKSIH